jgi:hypothetical protein
LKKLKFKCAGGEVSGVNGKKGSERMVWGEDGGGEDL